MARYLLCATPAGGHVTPILAVASALGDRGHEVTVLTGSRFRSFVESCGIAFHELTRNRSMLGCEDMRSSLHHA
ncbi:glycosyltransferase [Rhodococcus pyridinivorans]|uniref:glycosyltransferase n=1 Tax=Rhodococcus pyridinivorans TaxID=103816 RepID=UPI00200A1FEE|nr:glycosyltransferase [Rhodococcus pyridinivorans]UPW04727.1 glycosyltransferase [Rhodococcus pyridinivorans]